VKITGSKGLIRCILDNWHINLSFGNNYPDGLWNTGFICRKIASPGWRFPRNDNLPCAYP